ncbi:tautomerase family protein [Microbacterium sp.]|uniref:tautomerase family protein n=1 Tax=Microbacterium sp. TaxID=51671 RepID=UPI003C2882CE
MPIVTVQLPAGSLDPEQKTDLIARITDTLVDVEKAEQIRPFVYVIIDETSRDGYGLGGVPVDVALAKAAQR